MRLYEQSPSGEATSRSDSVPASIGAGAFLAPRGRGCCCSHRSAGSRCPNRSDGWCCNIGTGIPISICAAVAVVVAITITTNQGYISACTVSLNHQAGPQLCEQRSLHDRHCRPRQHHVANSLPSRIKRDPDSNHAPSSHLDTLFN